MKYNLVIGFMFKKHKRPADVTLSIGDRMIDKFQIEKDYSNTENIMSSIDTKWYKELDIMRWLCTSGKSSLFGHQPWRNIPKFFKIYQLDEQYVKDYLVIEVDNANNDYTNGFMRNSSLIKLSIVALFPNVLTKNSGEQMMKIYRRIGLLRDKHIDSKKSTEEVATAMQVAIQWPTVRQVYVKRQDDQHEKSGLKYCAWDWIGGSFITKIPIKKKHGVKYLTSAVKNQIGFPAGPSAFDQVLFTCKPLLNTYNEDQ